jgi:hypothetical protein
MTLLKHNKINSGATRSSVFIWSPNFNFNALTKFLQLH